MKYETSKPSYNTPTHLRSPTQEIQRAPMEKTNKILRRSIYSFLQNYQYFTSTAALLAFPFSLSILLSQIFVSASSSSSLLPAIYDRLKSLFDAAGFPSNSDFFSLLNLKLSQTISSSIFTLPFTLTFLLAAKASTIQALKDHHKPPSFSSILSIFNPLILTYICNSLLIISANATAFCLLFFSFNFLEGLGFSSPTSFLFLSAAGAVLYSIILANALVICNMALVLSGMEKSGGYLAILKACVMLRGRASTALLLALPVNLTLAGIEALFQYRIVRSYNIEGVNSFIALEGMLIAFLYSILLVLDTVVNCMFYQSCKARSCIDNQERRYTYRIQVAEEKNGSYVSLKVIQDVP